MSLTELETFLKNLLHGEHSSLSITYNNDQGLNYLTMAEYIETYGEDDLRFDWVSEEEKEKAIRNNSVWAAQWYPSSPVSFFSIAASSLPALIEGLKAYVS